MEWHRPAIVELIKAVKSRPAIWDINSKQYRDKYKRRQCFCEIAQQFGCTRAIIEKKVANLRTQYGREIAKIAKSKSSSGETYESKWFAFKLLSFLKPKKSPSVVSPRIIKNKPTPVRNENPVIEDLGGYVHVKLEEGNLPNNEMTIEIDDGVELLNSENLTGRTRGRQDTFASSPALSEEEPCLVESTSSRIVHNMHDFSSSGQYHQKLLKSKLDEKYLVSAKDEYDIFGQSVAAQLKNIPDPYARSIAKFNIQKALFEAEVNVYNPQSLQPN